MTTLKLDKIYKKYPNATHYSVEDFSIDIKDKEFIVFVGPSDVVNQTTSPYGCWSRRNHRR